METQIAIAATAAAETVRRSSPAVAAQAVPALLSGGRSLASRAHPKLVTTLAATARINRPLPAVLTAFRRLAARAHVGGRGVAPVTMQEHVTGLATAAGVDIASAAVGIAAEARLWRR